MLLTFSSKSSFLIQLVYATDHVRGYRLTQFSLLKIPFSIACSNVGNIFISKSVLNLSFIQIGLTHIRKSIKKIKKDKTKFIKTQAKITTLCLKYDLLIKLSSS
jgi:hypothetical protein